MAIERQETTGHPAAAHIAELTGAKVRVFLSEVAEGVSNYRSMHSLTQQVEHQYHGRFLIELLQNAHDTFTEDASAACKNRVEIVFDPMDSEHGSLLVANDGAPFSPSDFERLSQLGQSDKDPQKSIGNKGIGFRGVLEISAAPEIYSKESPESASFNGYCFAFRPDVVTSLIDPIIRLAVDENLPIWSITGAPVVDNWSDEMLRKFRRRVLGKPEGWLPGEMRYLSPYLLPVPLGAIQGARVREFESHGFSTVVRLPLKSADLRAYVLERMAHLSGSTVLFLERIGTLRVLVHGEEDRTFIRTQVREMADPSQSRVDIVEGRGAPKAHWVWSRGIHVPSAPEGFRKAVAALPGRWPEITDIAVAVAVRIGDEPDTGRFSIYLPTLVPTGSAVHINAPFFGDMSRTAIPFGDAYNLHLLETAVDLSIEVVRKRLAGAGEDEARAIIDFLAPLGSGPAAARWLQLIEQAEERAEASLSEEAIVLTDDGWQPLNVTSLIPTSSKVTLLTEATLRRHATFSIFHQCLDSRSAQVKNWAAHRFGDVGAYPLASALAATIAAVATDIHAHDGDWNAYWRDITILLPLGQAELAKHTVLLGSDNALHRAGEHSKVFFVPRQGTQDDSDIGMESTAAAIPATLRSSVAFLSEQIQLYDPNRPTAQTPVRNYLGHGLVSPFRVESIFTEVLHQLTPTMPVNIDSAHSDVCRDILVWAIRLMTNVVARNRGTEPTLKLLRSIPVPCEGGWFPMEKASFSDGWPGSAGETLKSYLGSLGSQAAREGQRRLLLPPGHAAWGGVGTAAMGLLLSGGVFDGIRLVETKTGSWHSTFRASMHDLRLPGPPPGLRKEFWMEYTAGACAEVRPPFAGYQPYQVGTIYTFPGMAEFQSLSDEVKLALSDLVIRSLPNWEAGLGKLAITKQGGQWNRLDVTSPLSYFLRSMPWLALREPRGVHWARPFERWYVPIDALAGRAKHFAHLRALPAMLAKTVGAIPALAAILHRLGMHFFDPHTTTEDPSLLMALTSAVGSAEVSDANVLLGQIREAWQRFRPASDAPPLPLVAVRRHARQFTTVTPTETEPAYLPDSSAYISELEQFNFPVIAIGTADAKDMREWFTAAYGPRILRVSELSLVPQVAGEPWTGFGSTPLADSDLGWLVRPMLIMAAQGRSLHSPAFKERVEMLRTAQICWVPDLSVAVTRGEVKLASADVAALWDPVRKTVLATHQCRTRLDDLAGALSQALERDDLELQLRYVLHGVASADSAPEDYATFLAPLRIPPEQVHQVLEHLRGDVGHACRLLTVLLAVLRPEWDSTPLQAAATEEELMAGLAAAQVAGLDVGGAVRLACDSQDLFDFGRAISPAFGELASLARWNLVLARMGGTVLVNRNWSLQLQAGLEEAAALMKRVFAHAVRMGMVSNYAALYSQYQTLATATDLGGSHWQIDFSAVMHIVSAWAESWLTDSGALAAVRGANSAESLRAALAASGVQMALDPDECGRRNVSLVEKVAMNTDRLRLAAWIKCDVDTARDSWRPRADEYRAAAAAILAGEAFTRELSEQEVLELLKHGVLHPEMPQFQVALDTATDLAALKVALDISSDDLATAQARLDAVRAERNRRKSVIKVCGEDFDSSEDNLGQLWELLSSRISDADLAKTMPLDLAKPVALATIKRTTQKRDVSPKPSSRSPERQPKAIDELVGLAGEIHVYRMLRQQYGEDAVPASAWISENGRRVFGHNQADDGRGCDFAFTVNGRQYRVEVKASSGDDAMFTLGSSEIRLAMDIGIRGKRRKEKFILVHVRNALTAQPMAVVLPNPYDPKHSGVFDVEEAGARVRYRIRG